MASIPDRVTRLEAIIEGIGKDINEIRTDIRDLRARMDSMEQRMFWMWGSTMLVMVAGFATLIANTFLGS